MKGVTLVFCGILFYILISSGRLVLFRYRFRSFRLCV